MPTRLPALLAFFMSLLCISAVSGLTGPISSITVPGTSAGTETGLYLIAGDLVVLSASGAVNTLPPSSGNLASPAGNGFPCTASCLLPSAQFGALVGRIGDHGLWFYVGPNLTINSPNTGRLYLAVNDTIHDNNTGQFIVSSTVTAGASFSCAATSTALCLDGNRFRVQVFWRLADGTSDNGQVVPYFSSDSGIFWFFGPNNWELMVKVLNGCGLNQRHWVFAAATTNVEFILRVRDTNTGIVRMYFNPLGRAADALTDVSAFSGCS
jgi:hypothetical protein